MKFILGIDPGLTGAIAFLDENGKFIAVHDMPVMPNGKAKARIKQQVNAAALVAIMRDAQTYTTLFLTAYLEQVSARPGEGVSSSFSFGDSFGTVRGVLAALGIPMTMVQPHAWKKHFGLLRLDKDYSRTKAQQLYPCAPLELKKHGGRAEALLIGAYGVQEGKIK